jgi:hypothetical protein
MAIHRQPAFVHCAPASIHAVITNPPYGLIEYAAKEQGKLRAGRGVEFLQASETLVQPRHGLKV